MRYFFKPEERLKSLKEIDYLFKSGKSFYIYPIRTYYQVSEDKENSAQVLFSIPKRNFKHAVDRNLLKRRIREAYRLNKHLLSLHENQIKIAFVYTETKILEYQPLLNSVREILNKLSAIIV